jgi:hypothetical protein
MSNGTEHRKLAAIMFTEITGYCVQRYSWPLLVVAWEQKAMSSRFSPITYSITPPPRQISPS